MAHDTELEHRVTKQLKSVKGIEIKLFNDFLLLFIGSILSIFSNLRFLVPELAWISSVPFLVYAIKSKDRKSDRNLFFAVVITSLLTVAKIVTPPISYAMVPLFALPLGITSFFILIVARSTYHSLGILAFTFCFASLSVAGEWIIYTFSPNSAWGALAFTQSDRLEWIQFGSVSGISGLSFIISFVNASLSLLFFSLNTKQLILNCCAVSTVIALSLFGSLRLDKAIIHKRSLRVAGVISAVPIEKIPSILLDPSKARPFDDGLFDRTEKAAKLGARVIIWNEVATLTSPDAEPLLKEKIRSIAVANKVHIVAAYGVLASSSPISFENKYVWFSEDGAELDEYWKRHPVPGEGSIAGNQSAKIIEVDGIKTSGAICYDFDFPHIARDLANAGAELVVLPSSDWRGIDPLHSRMARYMAVSTGMALFRTVRAAESFASDSYGRTRGSMSGDSASGYFVVDLPIQKVNTLYAKIGEVWGIFCFITSLSYVAVYFWRKRKIKK